MTEQAKAARAAYARKYRADHKEQIAAAKRKYYETHKEQVRESARKYYADHKEMAKRRNSVYWDRKAMNGIESPESPLMPDDERRGILDDIETAHIRGGLDAGQIRDANSYETPECPSKEVRLMIKRMKLASRIRESMK